VQRAITEAKGATKEDTIALREQLAHAFVSDLRTIYPNHAEGVLLIAIGLHAWMTGEPGILFEDIINDPKNNPLVEIDGPIKSTNPCGEIGLYPNEPCDLGALNLAAYVQDGGFNKALFRQDVHRMVEYLDDNLDYCKYPVEQSVAATQRNRRIGAGIMGLGDALVKLGLPYGSPEAQVWTQGIMEAYGAHALERSEQLAAEKGEPEWSRLARERGIIQHARRNVALLTIAPTGTTSMLLGVSSGIEPIFSPFIWRKIGSEYVSILHPLFKEEMEKHTPHDDYMWLEDAGTEYLMHWDWDKVTDALQTGHGSIQDFDWIPQPIKDVFVFAHDVTPEQHVRMQAAAQAGMDFYGIGNSISKTINLPQDANVTDVLTAYTLAFETRCKGITVYRDGSRAYQVLNTSKATETTTSEEAEDASQLAASTPPVTSEGEWTPDAEQGRHEAVSAALGTSAGRVPAIRQKISIAGQTWYLIGGYTHDSRLHEVFIAPPKGDAFMSTTASVVGRLISIALQHGVPAHDIANVLDGHHDNTGGLMTGLGKGSFVSSIYDGFADAIRGLIINPEPAGKSHDRFIQDAVANTEALHQPVTYVPAPGTPAHPMQTYLDSVGGLQDCPNCKQKTFNKAECVCLTCGETRCG